MRRSTVPIDRRTFVELAALGGGAVFVASLPGCGSGTPGADSAAAASSRGFTSVGLARLHDDMAALVTKGNVPGLVTLVSRRGQIEVDAIGNKALGSQDPMRRDSIFRIASMTKPITAAAAMILVEDGKLRLDEPIDRLLPELANRRVLKRVDGPIDDTVPANRPITVDDLLTFRLGFGMVFPFDTWPIQKAAEALNLGQGLPRGIHVIPEPNEWVRRFATLPLMYQPGERWLYHTGSDILGVLIARASGQSLATFFQERIFAPLGMVDTGFSVPKDKLNRIPAAYWANAQTKALDQFDGMQDSQYAFSPAFPSGGGGLCSTVDDFHAFARMLVNKGEHADRRVLSANSVERMTSDHLTPQQKSVSGLFPGFFDTRGWGFGVSIVTKADSVSAVPGRYGWDGGFGTHWFNDSAQDLVAMVMTQRAIDETFPAPVFDKVVYEAVDH